MEVYIKFNIDNAAFDDFGTAETMRVLNKIAARIDSGETQGNILDVNGNKIGVFMHSYRD